MKKAITICLSLVSIVLLAGLFFYVRSEDKKIEEIRSATKELKELTVSLPTDAEAEDDEDSITAAIPEDGYEEAVDAEEATPEIEPQYKKPYVNENGLMEWSMIRLGHYPQTGSTDEPVDWLILDIDDDNIAFVVSKYILDCKKIYTEDDDFIPWKDNPIRDWLNNDMYNDLFTDDEKMAVKHSTIVTDSVETEEYLFLLSGTDVDIPQYGFTSDYRRQAENTSYAEERGNFTSEGMFTDGKGKGKGVWWLRSSVYYEDDEEYSQEYVKPDGRIWDGEVNPKQGIRPAMYVDLNNANVEYSGTFSLLE